MRQQILCAALSIVLVAACDRVPTAPVAPGVPRATPARDRSGAAPKPGGADISPAAFNLWLFGQPESGLVAWVGMEPPVVLANWCAGHPGGDWTYSPYDGQEVVTPSERAQFRTFSSDAYVELYAYHGTAIPTSACQLVGAPVVATGRVTLTVNVSNLNLAFGFTPAGPGAATIHGTINGVVTLTSGGEARVHGTWQAVIAPDGTVRLDREPIRLTPL